MMRQALEALGPKTLRPLLWAGGAALAIGALVWPRAAPPPATYRLVLHAPENPRYSYLSAWHDRGGEVFIDHDASDRRPVVYSRHANGSDGCSWEGVERLTPIGPRAYLYAYDETILSCRAGAHPYRKTPRVGFVTVEPVGHAERVTPLAGEQAPLGPRLIRYGCPAGAQVTVVIDVAQAVAEADQAVDQAMADVEQALHDADQAVADDDFDDH